VRGRVQTDARTANLKRGQNSIAIAVDRKGPFTPSKSVPSWLTPESELGTTGHRSRQLNGDEALGLLLPSTGTILKVKLARY
jgi:hypothetical protein